MERTDLFPPGHELGILLGMRRRGFLGLLSKATLVVAAARIPFVSPIVQKVAASRGWLAASIAGKKYYIQIFS
jgi:hypothetical protein